MQPSRPQVGLQGVLRLTPSFRPLEPKQEMQLSANALCQLEVTAPFPSPSPLPPGSLCPRPKPHPLQRCACMAQRRPASMQGAPLGLLLGLWPPVIGLLATLCRLLPGLEASC
jgi:hypothetical protein